MGIRFRLLGPVEADIDGQPLQLGHARQRSVLVALLVDAGRVVSTDVLLDRVWGDCPPRRARVTLAGYVSRLRRMIPGSGPFWEPGGYRLDVDPMTVDLHQFHDLVTRARASSEGAEALLTEALQLWRGDAFTGLETPWSQEVRAVLDAGRHAAELDRNDLALAHGRHGALVAELSSRAAAHPFDERLAGQLLLALYRCGRVADALRHYETIRRGLAEELGADPSPALQELHQRILAGDPTLTMTSPPVPRQLPAPLGGFAGRFRELDRLDALVGSAGAVVVSAVSGTAGVGKTALALHWAHRVADKFDDGQLYVNLRGFDPGGSVMSPAIAVRMFLDGLGVAPHRIPQSLDAQTALYRSLLAGRRMLIVLDNARDAEHVRPLLPGASGCVVLVTSRDQLTDLVAAEGAELVTLDVLSPIEARDLLSCRIGPDRVAAERDAVAEIITRCARLPLALAIVAARAVTHPTFPLETFARELRADPVSDVRAVFSWSYRTLSPSAAIAFRLLGLHPGPDFGVPAVASVAGLPIDAVRPALAELTKAQLLIEHQPGRYTFHDLLRAYAAEQASTHDSEEDRRAATHRMLDHYLHAAHCASIGVDPHRADPTGDVEVRAGVVAEHIDDFESAMAWFSAERQVLLAVIELAAGSGFESHSWRLAWTLADYRTQQGLRHEVAAAIGVALDAARRGADLLGEALMQRLLGCAQILLGRFEQAHGYFQHALALLAELGDHHPALAVTHRSIGAAAQRQGRNDVALRHAHLAMAADLANGDRVGYVRSLNMLGWCQTLLGDHREALEHCAQALALYREIDDPTGEAATLDSLGYIHHHLGNHEQAIDYYERALQMFREARFHYLEGDALNHIGDTYHAIGNHDAARKAWRQALLIFADFDHPDTEDVRVKLAS
jgi:DNA-binding SARP family transcriptional activator/tetratricopeptide (TPR) repeat protein